MPALPGAFSERDFLILKYSHKELIGMVQHKCLKPDCDGTMSLVGVALNGTLFYWCPECKRLFMVFDTGMWNTVEYKMKKWQPPAA